MKKFYIGKKDVKKAFAGKQKVKKIFSGKTLVWQDAPDEVPHFSFIAAKPGTSVALAKEDYDEGAPEVKLLFSTVKNGEQSEWQLWDKSAVQLDAGDELQLRATPSGNVTFAIPFSPNLQNINDYNYFVINGEANVSGRIGALLDENDLTSLSGHNCAFGNMFKGCASLLNAPDLYFSEIAPHAYHGIFTDCSSIVSTNGISAEKAEDYCFTNMFEGCHSLTAVPEMKSYSTAQHSHQQMFYKCNSLTSTGQLPDDMSHIKCCQGMFQNCSSLLSSDDLRSDEIGDSACNSMFENCMSLKFPPKIKATELPCHEEYYPADGGNLRYMFQKCSSLTDFPRLEFTQVPKYGVDEMFEYCSNLSSIDVKFSQWPSGEYPTGWWVQGVAPYGIFICPEELPEIHDNEHIPIGWEVRKYREYEGLRFTAAEDNSTVQLSAVGSPEPVSISVSYDYGITWQEWDKSEIKLRYEGDYVCLKGNNTRFARGYNDRHQFVMSGKIVASGNIMSILDPSYQQTDISYSYCFCYLFSDCSSLVSMPDLPAARIPDHCYYGMFYNCSSLSGATEMPFLYAPYESYRDMFRNCTSLKTVQSDFLADEIGVLACYEMFYGCSALTAVPTMHASSIRNGGCQIMFRKCSSLSAVSTLSATSLGEQCYDDMFADCTSLTTAPELPATQLNTGCYNRMFGWCTALLDAPYLPATELANYCYQNMFIGCMALSSISAEFTSWTSAENATSRWVEGVSPSGTFTCPASLPQIRGASNIPINWTVVSK